MERYIISYTADYEDYMLKLSFSMLFSSEKTANVFAENVIDYIEVSKYGISVVSNSSDQDIKLCGHYVFKRLNGIHSKAPPLSPHEIKELKNNMTQSEFDSLIFNKHYIIRESDYQTLEKKTQEVFNEMCDRYGSREYFVFSISSFSVTRCSIKSH